MRVVLCVGAPFPSPNSTVLHSKLPLHIIKYAGRLLFSFPYPPSCNRIEDEAGWRKWKEKKKKRKKTNMCVCVFAHQAAHSECLIIINTLPPLKWRRELVYYLWSTNCWSPTQQHHHSSSLHMNRVFLNCYYLLFYVILSWFYYCSWCKAYNKTLGYLK